MPSRSPSGSALFNATLHSSGAGVGVGDGAVEAVDVGVGAGGVVGDGDLVGVGKSISQTNPRPSE